MDACTLTAVLLALTGIALPVVHFARTQRASALRAWHNLKPAHVRERDK
jgi:hypothetical protein